MDLDDSREVCFCSFCGTKHVIKDEIINNTVVNNYGQPAKSAEELVADGEALLRLNQIEKAFIKFRNAIDAAPNNFRAWFGYARTLTLRKTESDPAYETAYRLANEQEIEVLINEWIRDIGAKNDVHIRKSYDFLCRICGDGVKDTVCEIWAGQIKKDIAERKKFVYAFDNTSSFSSSDDDGAVQFRFSPSSSRSAFSSFPFGGGLPTDIGYHNSYGLFRIEQAFDLLDTGEKEYIISEMKEEANRLAKKKGEVSQQMLSASGVKGNKIMIKMVEDSTRKDPNSMYSQYNNAIGEILACLERLNTVEVNTEQDSNAEEAQKKKRFWKK
jgi:tetratricopeptide (TPR) repeat protein